MTDHIFKGEPVTIADSEGWIPEEPTDLDLEYICDNVDPSDNQYPECNKKMSNLLIDCFANLLEVVNVQIYDIDTIKRLSDHHYKGFMVNALSDFEAGDIIHHHMYISWLSIPETLDTRESIIEYINDCLYTVNKFTTN